ncbi:MAG TPA: hypothetical protein LFW21_00190 [Rickettsia endosymbiont of Pyrocoelia pectoralis]|nr:hypothetical protein [Rickettsia endosymbiont of Pyrocoelia pectoralis]
MDPVVKPRGDIINVYLL